MKNQYRRELERLGPSREELERLYTMIEEGTLVKRNKHLGMRAAAVLACAALLMITAAVAAAPTVWDALMAHLGVFAPYAQTIEDAVSTDQGIELRVLSALTDDLKAQVFLSVRDVDQDRLDQCLTLTGRLTAGEAVETDAALTFGGCSTSRFQLVSYDPARKTALLSASIYYGETAQPSRQTRLTVTGMSTQLGELYGSVSCASVTGQVLESLPSDGEVICRPSDLDDRTDLDALIPSRLLRLAPEQNPTPIEGTEDMWISSMGFASDGYFHIRVGLADGVRPEERGFFSDLFQLENRDKKLYTYQQTLVEGGMDIFFPLLRPEDLELIRSCEVRLYGPYTRSGTEIAGHWSTEFQMEYFPSVTLDWTGRVTAGQVRQVTISPLSVTMRGDASGGLDNITLYAVKADGSTVAANPGIGRYSKLEASSEGTGWDAFNTWEFQEPLDLEEVVSLRLGDKTIPVN